MTGSKRGPRARIRRATPEDCGALIELQREFYREDRLAHDARNTRALRRLLRSSDAGAVWVIEASEPGAARPAIGYCVLTLGYTLELGGRDAFIDELYLRPEWRGRGLGVRALRVAEAAARRRGVRAMHLEVDTGNRRARRLYERWGFAVRDRYHLMVKPLGERRRSTPAPERSAPTR
jgi:ribosomal protein S18 acetylase RimI-like enzyme